MSYEIYLTINNAMKCSLYRLNILHELKEKKSITNNSVFQKHLRDYVKKYFLTEAIS